MTTGSGWMSVPLQREDHRSLVVFIERDTAVAYVHGVSRRFVDAQAEALGLKDISKDHVSRICKELDAQVHAFRNRALDDEYPHLMLDGTKLTPAQAQAYQDALTPLA